MSKKRTYPGEFKVQAVELVQSSGKSVSDIERELGITPGLLATWNSRLTTDGAHAFPGKGRLKLIRRLQRENDLLGQERDVLKKALAIFAKGQP